MKISLSAGGKKVDLRRFERWVLSRESGGGGVELVCLTFFLEYREREIY